MQVYDIDPCKDVRWQRFLDRRPDASVFHTPGWLEALRRTYGYEPVVYTTSAPGKDIINGQVFCRVDSWLTGSRLVSLPFSDHAGVLMNGLDDLELLLARLQEEVDRKNWRYVDIRPAPGAFEHSSRFRESDTYYLHRLSLDKGIESLLRSFHKNCVQRKIRRAEREKLDYTEGRSEALIRQFYRLLLLTQRRHHVPPQPISWFRNLSECLGETMKIRIASKNGLPIAGIVTLSYKNSMVYKYGSSDSTYHKCGAMAFLFWKAIQEAKTCGFTELDLGRSECDNAGLVTFKERWGAKRSVLTYLRYPANAVTSPRLWEFKAAKRLLAFVPASALPAAGRLLYRHVG
jgi:CelD/BcsL family acetyltransferase involved in cellulose biosynthesis